MFAEVTEEFSPLRGVWVNSSQEEVVEEVEEVVDERPEEVMLVDNCKEKGDGGIRTGASGLLLGRHLD